MVIVSGLYIVIWGKSKDKDQTSHNTTEQILPIDSPKTNQGSTKDDASVDNDVNMHKEIP